MAASLAGTDTKQLQRTDAMCHRCSEFWSLWFTNLLLMFRRIKSWLFEVHTGENRGALVKKMSYVEYYCLCSMWFMKVQFNYPGGTMPRKNSIQITSLKSSIKKSRLTIWLLIKERKMFWLHLKLILGLTFKRFQCVPKLYLSFDASYFPCPATKYVFYINRVCKTTFTLFTTLFYQCLIKNFANNN